MVTQIFTIIVLGWCVRAVGDRAGFEKIEASQNYTNVIVTQDCAPPKSAWHQVWVPAGAIL